MKFAQICIYYFAKMRVELLVPVEYTINKSRAQQLIPFVERECVYDLAVCFWRASKNKKL